MKNLKRIFTTFAALCLVFCIAACGSKEPVNTESEASEEASSIVSSSEETPAAESPKVSYLEGASAVQTALFGDLNGTKLRIAEDAVLEEWEEDFYAELEKTTGMQIEIVPMSSNELMTKIAEAVASGDTRNYFDVAHVTNSNLLNLVYSNLIIPIDSFVDKNDPVWQYDSSTEFSSLDLFELNGRHWAAPSYNFHETYIFYNKTHFKAMGAPDPYEEYYLKDNWTFETFLDLCEKVTRKNADQNVEVAAFATPNYFAFSAAAGNTAISQTSSGAWKTTISEPSGMAALNLLYESAKNGYLNTKTSGYDEFVNGKVAMIIDKPSYAIGATKAYSRMSDEIGMVPLPKYNKSQKHYICPISFSGYAIAACTQNAAGAAAFIYYHRIGEMRHDELHGFTADFLDQESRERRSEYLAKCDFSVPLVEGLQGWYTGSRAEFFKTIFNDLRDPASAIGDLVPLINDCLRRTVG